MIKCPKCGRPSEEDVIEEWGFCLACDHIDQDIKPDEDE